MKKDDEKYKSCRTLRTEARMASLLYIWNISFKSISRMRGKNINLC